MATPGRITIGGNRVYDIVPTRVWQVDEAPKETGTWNPLPPGVQTAGVRKAEMPGATIPDNDPNGLTRTLNVQQCGTVNVAHVDVDLSHPAFDDLKMVLQPPNGGQAVPLRAAGQAAPPLKGIFPTTLLPAGDFSTLLAESGNGDWKLQVVDTTDANGSGTLNAWGLSLYCGS